MNTHNVDPVSLALTPWLVKLVWRDVNQGGEMAMVSTVEEHGGTIITSKTSTVQ